MMSHHLESVSREYLFPPIGAKSILIAAVWLSFMMLSKVPFSIFELLMLILRTHRRRMIVNAVIMRYPAIPHAYVAISQKTSPMKVISVPSRPLWNVV